MNRLLQNLILHLQRHHDGAVRHAHEQHLWIRFYTLDGATPEQQRELGLFKTYNFPSLEAAQQRWRSLVKAGVDYIATDQYGEVRKVMDENAKVVADPASRASMY